MEAQNRRSHRDLIDKIRRDTPHFRFFQTVRLLALTQRSPGEKRTLPANLRFRTAASMAFPASEQTALRERDAAGEGDTPVQELEVSFMGLNGPAGILPNHYTELMVERQTYHRDTGMHEFFDIFNHRSLALFYSAWRKYRFWVGYESGESDGFSRNLMDMVGVGQSSRPNRQGAEARGGIPDRFFMHFAGLLAQKPLSAVNLAAIVQGFLDVPVALEQFVGQWITLPESEQIRLGGQCCTLGSDTFVGERIWERQNKLRLTIGPLDRAHFSAFLPGAPAAESLTALMRFALGHTLACDVTLILRREDIPNVQLVEEAGLMLGFNTWASSLPATEDSADVHYTLLQ